MALSSGFCDHLPSCSLILKDDDIAKTSSVRHFFWRTCFGLFVPLPLAVLLGFTQGQPFRWSGFWPNFLSAVLVMFHSWYQSNWISVPPSLSPMWAQGLNLTSYFWVLSAGSFPGPYTQCGISLPSEKSDVSWRGFPGRSAFLPIRRVLRPRKSWTFSFMLPYSREMMFVDISLDPVLSQRPLCGSLVRLPRPLSLFFPIHERWW